MQPIYNWDGDAMVLYIDKLDDLGRMFSYAINPMVIDMIVLNVKVIIFVSCMWRDYQLIYKNILVYYITSDSILKIDKNFFRVVINLSMDESVLKLPKPRMKLRRRTDTYYYIVRLIYIK